jgi:16S rRNA processing protein RimM
LSHKTPQLVMIGEIVRSHGLRGAVKVRAVAEMEQFSRLQKAQLQRGTQELGEYVIERVQTGNDGLFIKFQGVNDRDQADLVRGAQMMIGFEECLPAAPGQFYQFEIIGLAVFTASGQPVGEIVEVARYPANDVWVVRNGEEEKLIPAVDAVVQKVDMPNRRVIINPIPGLLDEAG